MKNVFVVDDNPLHANLAAKLIRAVSPESTVSVFHDPFLALSALLESAPDLMVLDFMMPKMDGLQLLREVRKKGIMTKTIMVSAFLKEVSARLLPSNNVSAVVTKPFAAGDFMRLVSRELGVDDAENICGGR